MEYVIQLVAALVGSLGFVLIFNPCKKTLFPSILGGMLGWAVYLLCEYFGFGVFVSTIIAAAFCQVYAEVFARIIKAPTTVFYIPAIVPLVPGGSLYYTVFYAATNNMEMFKAYGITTLQVAFGIGVGASFVSAIMLLLKRPKYRKG